MNIRDLLNICIAASLAGGLVLRLVGGANRWLAFLSIGVVGLFTVLLELPLLNRQRVRNTSYSLEEDFVYIARGSIFKRSVFIPNHQILNVETVQGPLLRRFGFVKVRFVCITEVESLGPLDAKAVNAIRVRIGERKELGGP